jgi:hypothetical protein
MRFLSILALATCVLVASCTSTGEFQTGSGTSVVLSDANYSLVRLNAMGASSGISLFGFIPLSSPTYAEAMTNLYRAAALEPGGANALTNVTKDSSYAYYFFISRTKLTVRADVVEFK